MAFLIHSLPLSCGIEPHAFLQTRQRSQVWSSWRSKADGRAVRLRDSKRKALVAS